MKHVSFVPANEINFLELIVNFFTTFICTSFGDICKLSMAIIILWYLFFLLSATSLLMGGQHTSWSMLNSNKSSNQFFEATCKSSCFIFSAFMEIPVCWDGDAIMPKLWSKNSFSKRPLLIYELGCAWYRTKSCLRYFTLKSKKKRLFFWSFPRPFHKTLYTHTKKNKLHYISKLEKRKKKHKGYFIL